MEEGEKSGLPPPEVLQHLQETLMYDPSTGIIWRRAGFKTANGYMRIDGSLGPRGKRLRYGFQAHRVAWFLMTGEWLGADAEIDHANRVRDDNRWENLRLCSRSQNAQNRTTWGRVKSRGVQYLEKMKTKRYLAQIGTWPNRTVIGYFETEKEASDAYLVEAKKRYGEFANLDAA